MESGFEEFIKSKHYLDIRDKKKSNKVSKDHFLYHDATSDGKWLSWPMDACNI